MKLKIAKDALLEGLQKVQPVVSARTTLPILQNILFKTDKEKLWLSATDLDLSVRAGVPAEVSKVGATTLPARRAAGIFKELPAGDIEVETDDKDQTSIRSGGAFFKI
ncbi:MAG: DNA polymerase III subunit beta, partial [Verrucomicrobia bacterium]|nr:DNA polymerase III subunit beta [Verrucomicrobiota bacterium]